MFARISVVYCYAMLTCYIILPASIITALAILYIVLYLLYYKFSLPRMAVKYAVIPFLMVVIGISGSAGNDIYNVLKDGWYFINPTIILLSAYLSAYSVRDSNRILRAVAIAGVVVALYHIWGFAGEAISLLELPIREIRREKGAGYFIVLLGFVVMLKRSRTSLILYGEAHDKVIVPFAVIASVLSLYLSFSRTLWFSLAIMISVLSVPLRSGRVRTVVTGGLIFACLMVVALLISGSRQEKTGVVGKLENTFNEVFIRDYYYETEAGRNWRGYESYMAMQEYLRGDLMEFVFGHGFGTLVDVKFLMKLGNERMRYIPILHNGYIYLLVKTGIVGLIAFLLYLYYILLEGMRAGTITGQTVYALSGRFIIALVFVLLFTTFVISGYFNRQGLVPVVFLLGAQLAFVRQEVLAESKVRKAS